MEEKEVLVTDNVTEKKKMNPTKKKICLLYTSDAADEL